MSNEKILSVTHSHGKPLDKPDAEEVCGQELKYDPYSNSWKCPCGSVITEQELNIAGVDPAVVAEVKEAERNTDWDICKNCKASRIVHKNSSPGLFTCPGFEREEPNGSSSAPASGDTSTRVVDNSTQGSMQNISRE